MEEMDRRTLLKGTLGAGASMFLAPMIWVRRAQATWEPSTRVHPQIDDLLVVGVTDPSMTRATEPHCGWARQEDLVVPSVVSDNLDKMACVLSGLKDPSKAWREIFVRPPGKVWSEVIVAIKTNNIALQHTRSAVMAKICHVLTTVLGVKPYNIHIYDAVHGTGMSRSTPFFGLPEGVKIEDTWGGPTAFTEVPPPWRGGKGHSKCIAPLVDGTVDILINVALCKGHSARFGGFTMTMKNHFGTFSPRPGHEEGSQDYLIAINKTKEILGSIDPRTGKVSFPRQQLCIVDALWASKGGPGGNPTHQPNFIAMGTFSPIVDYLVATRFRGDKMGWRPDPEMTTRFLTDFGYKESDLPNGGMILEV